MRLLQLGDLGRVTVTTNLLDENIPPYAVLSHTWDGGLGDELTLQDIRAGCYDHKPGYRKIRFCGAQARRDGLEYFWVDTCCIDKTSSAEEAEAINSMYRWYQNAVKCYVYLSDVSVSHEEQGSQNQAGPGSYWAVPNYTGLSYTSRNFNTGLNYTCQNYIGRHLLTSGSYTGPDFESLPAVPPSDSSWRDSFRGSRWFTRGWTLQELLAPSTVEFFTSDGRMVGDRQSLKHAIQSITGIPLPAFQNGWQSAIPVHERINWSNKRKTTRPEDKVYSLIGIVGVSMTVVYGEGEAEAFIRLCKEVTQRYEMYKDLTLLAMAARSGHASATRRLVSLGTAVDSLNPKGQSPILFTSEAGHEAIVRILLDAKASTESTDDGGDSPLLLAARGGHESIVWLLLDKGANARRKNKCGRTALIHAAQRGHDGVVRLLLRKLQKGADIEPRDSRGDSALAVAVRKGHEAVVRALLDKGAQVESKSRGCTPLMLAASNGHNAVIRLLLERGAKIDAADRLDHSALHYALKGGHEGAIRLLQRSSQTHEPPKTRRKKEARRSGVQGILSLFNS